MTDKHINTTRRGEIGGLARRWDDYDIPTLGDRAEAAAYVENDFSPPSRSDADGSLMVSIWQEQRRVFWRQNREWLTDQERLDAHMRRVRGYGTRIEAGQDLLAKLQGESDTWEKK